MSKPSISEKNKLEKRILEKIKLIKQSVGGENINPDNIKATLLREKGVVTSSTELAAQYKELFRQRDEMIIPYIREQQNALRISLSDLENRKAEEITAAQTSYQEESTK